MYFQRFRIIKKSNLEIFVSLKLAKIQTFAILKSGFYTETEMTVEGDTNLCSWFLNGNNFEKWISDFVGKAKMHLDIMKIV